MTPEQFNEAMDVAFAAVNVPVEFQDMIRSQAYERGHSSGYEEVFAIAEGLIYDFNEAFQKYKNRLIKNLENGTLY